MEPLPECKKELKAVDMSDIRADKAAMFQERHYFKIFFIFVVLLPTLVPAIYWGESLWVSYWVCVVTRLCINLNNALTINSIGHHNGPRPYDKNIKPSDNLFIMLQTLGEGNHNFHVNKLIRS
jgi:stearoyl-CoA desaturase (Delta-9 desaturase)